MGSREENRQSSEAEICMLLDTFMYLDYREAKEGCTLREVLEEISKEAAYQEGGSHREEYAILCEAAKREEIGNLIIGSSAGQMGYSSGTAAYTFQSQDGAVTYVVYRGTGDGEWPDNGLGMTQTATLQQKEALSYFEEVVENLELGGEQRLVVTGHSKGGNKAQFVTMESRYGDKIDVCYSVDGQGFSENAILEWKERYGEEEYEKRTKKLQGIHGENDYVSVLGYSIIPGENIRYVKTPVEKTNFAGYHDIKYMFATLVYDAVIKEYRTEFHGRKNEDAKGQGELGQYAAALSRDVMKLPEKLRDGCAAVTMQLMEMTGGRKNGLNGERLTLSDILDFVLVGSKVIAESLIKQEGMTLAGALFSQPVLAEGIKRGVLIKAEEGGILSCRERLEQLRKTMGRQEERVRSVAEHIPLYMKGNGAVYHQMKLSANRMEELQKKLSEIAQVYGAVMEAYGRWQEEAVSSLDFSMDIQ